MPESVSEYLRRDMECESLFECFHGLTELDRSCYGALVESPEALDIDEVAEHVDRERSTVYRSIQRLVEAGLVRREQVNYDGGGYYHVYYPADVGEVTDDMLRKLNDWYAKMGRLIHEFEEKYEDASRADG